MDRISHPLSFTMFIALEIPTKILMRLKECEAATAEGCGRARNLARGQVEKAKIRFALSNHGKM